MTARILTVEDTGHNLDLMTYLLEACGHEVLPARTGAAGLARALADRPDLVVLDLQLPDIDGFQVLTALRADPSTAGLPVVAVTAYAMVGDRDHVLAAGFDGYLAKPIDPATFVRSIDAFLPPERRGHRPRPRWRDEPAGD